MADNSAPLVVVFPRGQLLPKDKERLTKGGIIAVEADSPKDVHQLHLAQPLVCTGVNGDALVQAALPSISSSSEFDKDAAARTALRLVKHLSAALSTSTRTQHEQ